MNYKIITRNEIEQIYPNSYDQNILKSYKLMDIKLNTAFCHYYSCYKYYLEEYLKEKLELNNLEQILTDRKLKKNKKENFYKTLSNWDYTYLFLRNNIFLDRLTENEMNEFQKYQEQNDEKKLLSFVEKTYKKLIKFENGSKDEQMVNYDPTNRKNILVENNALVIGIDCEEDFPFGILEEIEEKYSKMLQLPVRFYWNNQRKILIKKETKEQKIELLPIGSVIELKNSSKKIMITGYAPITVEKKSKMYDYLGCYYPEGVVSNHNYLLFNHDKIEKVWAIGPIDKEVEQILSNFKRIKESGKKDFFLKEYDKTKE